MDNDRARHLLEAERQRITEEAANLGFQTTDELSTVDPGDTASDLYQEELDQGRLQDLQDQLAALERAEQRLGEGTYGVSVESGQPIPDERLELIPTAERTAEEQARFERGGF
jgi:RNA polymerase-binding transcription factor